MLINCPECKTEVSDKAAQCPKCAYPISQKETQLVSEKNVVGSIPKWSPGVAGVLSFFIPGLGQLYKGQPFNGITWFIFVAIGYFCLVVPGVILHILCILGALSGDPMKR